MLAFKIWVAQPLAATTQHASKIYTSSTGNISVSILFQIDYIIPLATIGGMPERLDLLKLMLDKGANTHYKNGNNELSIVNSMKKHLGSQEKFIPVIQLLEQYASI